MPRLARKDIETPFIHVMVQGVNKEYIFEEKRFLLKYFHLVKENLQDEKFELLAYCMMDNHAHFLFYVKDFDSFEKYMQINNQKFAQYYNKEKQRVGVVFRNRYRVEPIYDILYLSNCIKYIHNNPVEAGMVSRCGDYLFSSYNEYLLGYGVSCSPILKEIFGRDSNLIEIFDASNDRVFIDVEDRKIKESYIESGISEFVKKERTELFKIFSNRGALTSVIKFLKNDWNIPYEIIREYFGISKGVFEYINKINM